MMRFLISLICLFSFITIESRASLLNNRGKHDVVSSNKEEVAKIKRALLPYFKEYNREGYRGMRTYGIDSLKLDNKNQEVLVYPSESFCSQLFNEELLEHINTELSSFLPSDYSNYELRLFAKRNQPLEDLIPNYLRAEDKLDRSRLWGAIDASNYAPWTNSITKPYTIEKGLQNRHLMIWASHGYYYKNKLDEWGWQRPYLFCTTEDLLTQSIVYPFLLPMLERAGAIVATPRERDTQSAMLLIDNDIPSKDGSYIEYSPSQSWKTVAGKKGFAFSKGTLTDGFNPFESGSAKYIETVKNKRETSTARWLPSFTKSGSYAVYISYVSLPNSVTNARYIVYHSGGESVFTVNQQMGGNTWVYLGTFDFVANAPYLQGVVLSNQSEQQGVVSADAVRFGGGMGLSTRNEQHSHLPAYLEAARYYTQWAGLPDSLCNSEGGENDYVDDLRCRSYFANHLAGGSIYLPNHPGLGVPLELTAAIHTDAGHRKDGTIFGTLSISTNYETKTGDTLLPTGLSRMASYDLAHLLAENVAHDLSYHLGCKWTRRDTWNRVYSETRTPLIPSAILELLSHQNFLDMRYAHDPYIKFHIARSIYKSLLKYVNFQHGITDIVVQPLPVKNVLAQLDSEANRVLLTWQPTDDPLESSATPTRYIVYTKIGNRGFERGKIVTEPQMSMSITPGIQYCYRIAALNEGGESFPSEEVTVYRAENERARVLIVNGFTRVSGPAIVQQADSVGFDIEKNIGIPWGNNNSIAGRQTGFNPENAGQEGIGALGFCGSEWVGKTIAGNTFDFTSEHGRAIALSQEFSFSSASVGAVEQGYVNLSHYDIVDYILGRQKNATENIMPAKTFSTQLQSCLREFSQQGGHLIVSGSHIGSDMQAPAERAFLANTLGVAYNGYVPAYSCAQITGLNLALPIYHQPSEQHYAVGNPDILVPANKNGFPAFAYSVKQSAGVAYATETHRAITMAFPFECISDENIRGTVMRALLSYLLEHQTKH